MGRKSSNNILSTVPRKGFIGRAAELDSLSNHHSNGSGALIVAAKPSCGSSELLKQTYDKLFFDQNETVPFYFEFRSGDRSAKRAAVRFLQSFLTQFTAFRRNDPFLTAATPDICEISELSAPSDADWIRQLVDTCKRDTELNDESSFILHAFSAPLRATLAGIPVFPMIDGLEFTLTLDDSRLLFEQVKEAFNSFSGGYVLCGKRRFLGNGLNVGATRISSQAVIDLVGLSLSDSGALCESLGEKHGVATNEQTRDLISLQSDGSPFVISSLFHSASEQNRTLDSFKEVGQTYAREIVGGRLRGFYDSKFEALTEDSGLQRKLVELIFSAREFSTSPATTESWQQKLKKSEVSKSSNLMGLINAFEFVNVTSNLISPNSTQDSFEDYVGIRYRLECEKLPRPIVYGTTLTNILKRSPKLMAEHYRRKSNIGLREFLAEFDCQETPESLLFYDRFKKTHKGSTDVEIKGALATEEDKLSLPQIVYSVNTVSIYGQLSKFTENERSAVAIGFEAGDLTDESETVWIAAEIDSKLEAEAELTEFWCDRLEMVALMGDYHNFRIWLIAPEGFSDESLEVLQSRNAIGSSRHQVELLADFLGASEIIGNPEPENTFELVVPMGEDTELIAAHAIEEIARKHSFGSKAINQIKTALVEACINATEHSKSPDRKIYQRFVLEDDKLVVIVSNRGLRFKGVAKEEEAPKGGRRGWGLKLMKSLMDEVIFERVDDGTRISMTKFLKPA